MNNSDQHPNPSRLADQNLLGEIRKVLLIEFTERLQRPEWIRIIPNTDAIINDVQNGRRITYRSFLDDIVRSTAESFGLNPWETQELRELIFHIDK